MDRPRARIALVALAVALITAWVHWPCVRNGLLHWDDDVYLDRVVALDHLSAKTLAWVFTRSVEVAGYYHPLAWLSHLLDYQLWGLNAARYHATNVVLHATNAGLVVLYVAALLSATTALTSRQRLAVAAGAGLIFGIHPLQVEPVAWVAERKTLLCALFGLGCLWTHLKHSRHPERRGWELMLLSLFALSLLAKPMAVSWPLIMLAVEWYPLRRQATVGWARLLNEKLPLLALATVASIAAFITQSHQGALAETQRLGVVGRCFLAARSVVFYLWKLIWPAWLSPYYPSAGVVSLGRAEFWVPVAIVTFCSIIAVWRRKDLPGVGAAWVAYLALILPVSGIVPLGSYAAADRYMYVAMLPPLVLGAWSVVWLWNRRGRLGQLALAVLIACSVLFFAYRARAQIAVWHDDETLWSAVLKHFPSAHLPNCQMAMALADQRRFEEALPFARRAVESAPRFPEAHAALGLVQLKRRWYDEALMELRAAVSAKSSLLAARYNLACALSAVGQLDESLATLQKLFAQGPQYARIAAADPALGRLKSDPAQAIRLRRLLDETERRSGTE